MQRNNGIGPGVCARRGICMDRDGGQFGRRIVRDEGVGEKRVVRRRNIRVGMIVWFLLGRMWICISMRSWDTDVGAVVVV